MLAAVLATATGWAADASLWVHGRLRHEWVDDARLPDRARATTLRLHPTLRSADWHGLHAQAALDLTRHLGPPRFDDSVHGRTGYPVIADPDAAELDEAFGAGVLEAPRLEGWVGRRDWTVANARFFGGGLAWRQNAQSFDGAGLTLQGDRFAGELTWLERAHRVLGPRSPKGRQDVKGPVAELRWTASPQLRTTVLGADLRYADGPALPASASNRMVDGTLDWRPAATLGGMQPALRLELGTQRPRDAAGLAAGQYRSLQLCLAGASGRACAARESLTGDGVRALQTPLAGLHAFNGTADRFTLTPPDGLDDRALTAELRRGTVRLDAAAHDFRTTDGARYGTEIDLALAWQPRAGHTLLLKGADYRGRADPVLAARAPAQAADVSKLWLQWEFAWQR